MQWLARKMVWLFDIVTLLLQLSEKGIHFSEVVHFPICHNRGKIDSVSTSVQSYTLKCPTTEAVQFLGLIIKLEPQLRNQGDCWFFCHCGDPVRGGSQPSPICCVYLDCLLFSRPASQLIMGLGVTASHDESWSKCTTLLKGKWGQF